MPHVTSLRRVALVAALSLPSASAVAGPSTSEGAASQNESASVDAGPAEDSSPTQSTAVPTAAEAEAEPAGDPRLTELAIMRKARRDAVAEEKALRPIVRHRPRARSWEAGVFGGVATPSRGLDLRSDELPFKRYNRVAGDVGLRLGYYFFDFLGLEAEAALLPGRVAATDASVLMYSTRLQSVLQLPFWRVAPFGSVGVGLLGVSSDATAMGDDSDFIFSYGGGVKLYVTRNIGLRLDVRTNLSQKFIDPDAADSEEFLLGLVVRLGPVPEPRPPSDRDGDGFIDERDACPEEVGVEPDGCPVLDTDEDGFDDPVDACPEEIGLPPDGCPAEDTDGDGFDDPDDLCPEEAGVEPDGCPIRDTDEDGLFDDVDACIEEPETVNGYHDGDGCPDEVPVEVSRFTGAIKGIYFETGRANIRKRSTKALAAAAEVLALYPDVRLEISGHTDGRGERGFNMRLSADRAAEVKARLIWLGVDGSRLTTRGVGPDEPVADNETKKGRAANRRIEFKLIE